MKNHEEKHIAEVLKQFYDRLETQKVEEAKGKLKVGIKPGGGPKGGHHKIQVGVSDSVNPLESIEEEPDQFKKGKVDKEPAKPNLALEQEKEKIKQELKKEQEFLKNLLFMSRDRDFTNDPEKLYKMYKEEKEKARMGVVWGKGDSDAKELLKRFFDDINYFIARLQIAMDWKKNFAYKLPSHVAFYKKLQRRERLLFLIDKPDKESEKMIEEYDRLCKQAHYE